MDGDNPPTSIVEAYLIVAQVRVRRLAGIPWGDGKHDLADDEGRFLDAPLGRRLAVCARCGAGELGHFYTSKRDRLTLCAGCFQRRVERGQAREV